MDKATKCYVKVYTDMSLNYIFLSTLLLDTVNNVYFFCLLMASICLYISEIQL